MTDHVHDPAAHRGADPDSTPPGRTGVTLTRPWWLLPAILGAFVVGGLVVAGILPTSAVLYAGLAGGMLLMHMGGHGHGAHGGGGHGDRDGGHAGHPSGSDDPDLSPPSLGSQVLGPASASELEGRATDTSPTKETERHDQDGSHGCH